MPVALLPRSDTEQEKTRASRPPGSDRRRLRVLTAAAVTALVGAAAGPALAAVVLALILGASMSSMVVRRWPQASGSVLAVVATLFVAFMTTGTFGPWLAVSGSPDLGVALLTVTLMLFMAVWAAPLHGVHRGWTTLMALVPVWVAAPVAVAFPSKSALVALVAGGLGLVLLWWQARYRVRGHRSSRTKRGAKIALVALAAGMGLMSAAAVDPGKAEAWPLSGAFNSFKDDFVCSIASPNTSPELAGTGPEGQIGNYNFVQLPAADEESTGGSPNGVPTAMDRELQFDKSNLDQYTLYELSGLRGIKFINWSHRSNGDGDCSIMSWVSVTSGNMINMASRWLLQLTIFLKEYSNIKNPVVSFFDMVVPITDALLTVMFSFMACLIIGMLIWGLIASRRLGLSIILNKFGSALGAIIIATTAYGGASVIGNVEQGGNGFFTFTDALDTISGTVSSSVSTMILGNLSDEGTSMCEYPTGGDTSQVATAQRFSSCILAEALAYKPWAKATFGPDAAQPIEPTRTPMDASELLGKSASDDDADEDSGPQVEESPIPCYNNYQNCMDLRSYLIAHEGGPSILNDMEKCFENAGFDGDGEPGIKEKRACNPYFSVAEDLYARVEKPQCGSVPSSEAEESAEASDVGGDSSGGNNPESSPCKDKGSRMLSAYRGDGTFSHASNALTSLIGVLVVGTALGFLAGAVIWKHVELLILFMLGPGYLMSGALRNNLAGSVDWLKKIVGTFISLTVYSIIGSAAVFLIALISMQDVGLVQQLLMMALVLFGFFKAFSIANQKVNAATGTSDAPGQDRVMNKTQSMLAPAAVAGLAARAGRGRSNGRPGVVRQATRGTGRMVGSAARATGRGAQAAGRGVANNTRGLQFAAGQLAGKVGSGATYATARAKSSIAESTVGEKARNLGTRMSESKVADGARTVGGTAATAGTTVGSFAGKVKRGVTGEGLDQTKSAWSQGTESGNRVVAGAANAKTGDSTGYRHAKAQERARQRNAASKRQAKQDRQSQAEAAARRQQQQERQKRIDAGVEQLTPQEQREQIRNTKKRTRQNVRDQAAERSREAAQHQRNLDNGRRRRRRDT